jgi:hypothetical protein
VFISPTSVFPPRRARFQRGSPTRPTRSRSVNDEIKRKLDVLRAHCDQEDRDCDEIRKTVLGGDPFGDSDWFLRSMEDYAKLGVEWSTSCPPGPTRSDMSVDSTSLSPSSRSWAAAETTEDIRGVDPGNQG